MPVSAAPTPMVPHRMAAPLESLPSTTISALVVPSGTTASEAPISMAVRSWVFPALT